jgi:hypothetical protein
LLVAIVRDKYWVLRLSREDTVPPRIAMLGRSPWDLDNYWFSERATYNAAISFYRYWTMNITQCIFRVKQLCLLCLAECPERLWFLGLDVFNAQVIIFVDEVCTVPTMVCL